MPAVPTVSQRIRARIAASRQRFHANDNISEFIEPGELEELTKEVAAKMSEVLESLVIDVEQRSQHARDRAPRRQDVRERSVPRTLRADPKVTEFPNASHLNELMIIGPITVRSACSHHLCPIMGRLWIGVMPNEHSNLIGLSKYSRLADWIMSRPQIQEEAVIQLADMLWRRVNPDGLAVVMEADHFCMHWRGVKDNASKMINSVMRGVFLKDGALRREFLSLINLNE